MNIQIAVQSAVLEHNPAGYEFDFCANEPY